MFNPSVFWLLFTEYMYAVTHGFKETSKPCVAQIKAGFQQLISRINGTNKAEKLKLNTDLKYF